MKATPYLSRALPKELEPLLDLTTDLRWTWSHSADALWQTMDPQIWGQTENPYVVLQNLSEQRLEELAKDPTFIQHLHQTLEARETYESRPSWFSETYADSGIRGIAYFSMEFGLGKALPLYAGGLGILAGDYLKAASDLGVPLFGIGLLYQEGYFRQNLGHHGWQHETYPYNDPAMMPLSPVPSSTGAWMAVDMDFPGRRVRFRVWQAKIGRVTLYLLDSNDPLNSPTDRGITSKLYGGDLETRLMQEAALGICGWRLIEKLGLPVDICHLNEGHAAFVTVERARCYMDRHNVDFWQALWATRGGNIFTTHTPVSAGFDRFPAQHILKYGADYMRGLNVDEKNLLGLGRKNPNDDQEPFNMAYLAMHTCTWVNGVSQLHGDVSRQIFSELYPRWPLGEVPVGHITNGVHVPSWDSPWADELWTSAVDKERWLAGTDPLREAIAKLSDEQLWSFKAQERADLVAYARRRHVVQRGYRGASQTEVEKAHDILNPNVLTLGFARRFAEYKRPNLLLHDEERLVRLLTNEERPMQIIVAGKAHPQDDTGKRFIQAWSQFSERPEVQNHVVFLEDYDMALAQEMVQGVDVWVNNPRRPWEACGTSGMKVLVNGGLNLSVLDGWWAEAYNREWGWAVGDEENHSGSNADAKDAQLLYEVLEQDVIPKFYQRDTSGIPRAWVGMMRASMAELAPRFSTNRMMREYLEALYLPAANVNNKRLSNNSELSQQLCSWELSLRHHWRDIRFGNFNVDQQETKKSIQVQVYLGDVPPSSIEVQLYADRYGDDPGLCVPMTQGEYIPGSINGYVYYCEVNTSHPQDALTPRVIPYHPEALIPAEAVMIKWFR